MDETIMNDYEDYIRIQVEVHGAVDKPAKYGKGERKAIDWFFNDIDKNLRILDLGCGSGVGVEYLIFKGYENVVGIDINSKKVAVATSKLLPVFQRDLRTVEFKDFDIVWSSHSFEHMYDPVEALDVLKQITRPDAEFFFVMPYVDTGDESAHCSSHEIGLRENDRGKSVREWFSNQGLVCITQVMDDYREPEIWLKLAKYDE
ncbi:unnamed protein product [marine sediment metagenome]|uniref:Methyltransferase type 11 domain-containing protein n=1 Tax=marine sediment metagenome TaxID=412755 RepID=X1I460_9ZZZZ